MASVTFNNKNMENHDIISFPSDAAKTTEVNTNFRIREFRGEFEIQKKITVTEGMLWWKKSKEVWRPIDISGQTLYKATLHGGFTVSNYSLRNPSYKSLEEAKEAIQQILKGSTYHKY